MINCGRLKLSYVYYKLAEKLCICPFEHSRETLTFGYIRGGRYLAWRIQYFLACLYGVLVFARLMQLLLLESGQINLVYISVHTAVALMSLLNIPHYRMFLGQRENNILLVNHLLKAVQKVAEDQVNGVSGYLRG